MRRTPLLDVLRLLDTRAGEGTCTSLGDAQTASLLRLELERQRCLDPALVASLARAQSKGNALWQTARRDNDFPTFAPALAELIALRL